SRQLGRINRLIIQKLFYHAYFFIDSRRSCFLFDHLQIICDMFLLLEKSMHETYMGENIE
ncbi:hypothetical protein, partial [Alistipes onderdonkii]|uniref:hypothetical protein n=1 Tax=Alistipes onderdonkii TaxID=328813 RepID=UPI0032EE6C75